MPLGLGSHEIFAVSNYEVAVARAIVWLADRYLLAKPLNSNAQLSRPMAEMQSTMQSGAAATLLPPVDNYRSEARATALPDGGTQR